MIFLTKTPTGAIAIQELVNPNEPQLANQRPWIQAQEQLQQQPPKKDRNE
jgi:hypothetical protein